MDLDSITGYRKALIENDKITKEKSSLLIIVGREDTGGLEAQIRGSRHAWDIRLISVDALIRLMYLKEQMNDPDVINRIWSLLIPREFTRLDEIVQIMFSTAEETVDISKDEEPETDEINEKKSDTDKSAPASFHKDCIALVEKHLKQNIVKQTRSAYSTPDENIGIICVASKTHKIHKYPSYWFAFHPYYKDFLKDKESAYVVLGCGAPEKTLMIPYEIFVDWLNDMWTTSKQDRMYWHVRIHQIDTKLLMDRKKGLSRIPVSEYLIGKT